MEGGAAEGGGTDSRAESSWSSVKTSHVRDTLFKDVWAHTPKGGGANGETAEDKGEHRIKA